MKKKLLYILILITISSKSSWGQQESMYTHYSFNTLSVNPAYAGSREALSAIFLNRMQWVGFDGAPITQTFSVHTPLFKEKIGAGVSVVNDKIGPVNTTYVNVDFAYRLLLNEESSLSFGLKGGGSLYSNKLGRITTNNVTDPVYNSSIKGRFLPNFGFGIYYKTSTFYVGAAAPKLLENNYATNIVSRSGSGEARHYNLMAGGVFALIKGGSVKIKPSMLVKVVGGASLQVDLTSLFYWKDQFWVGPMWRSQDAMGVLAGTNITPQLAIGYSFDWSYGLNTFRYNNGSHEIMLRYDFSFVDEKGSVSPRYF